MPAPQNPFDVDTGANTSATAPTQTQNLGLIASQAPQIAGAKVNQGAGTQQPAQAPAVATPTATAQNVTAERVDVDAPTQTVQGQLASILASGNPLLVQAQTRAKQAANERGLLNSSMAVSAGESALYDAAMPIASQDASTYAQAGLRGAEFKQEANLANQQATNRMTEFNTAEQGTNQRFNAGEQNTSSRQTQQIEAQQQIENARLEQQKQQTNAENQMKLMLQEMDAQTRTDLVNIEANYKTLMQASASASDLYQQTLRNISDITANKDMNAAAKNAAIQQQKELLQNGMNLIGAMNNIGVSELLDFGGSAGNGSGVTPSPVPAEEPRKGNPLIPDQWGSQGA